MGLLETLIIGCYVYSTAIFVWFQKKIDTLTTNHLKHLVAMEVQRQMELSGLQVDVTSERSDIVDNVD